MHSVAFRTSRCPADRLVHCFRSPFEKDPDSRRFFKICVDHRMWLRFWGASVLQAGLTRLQCNRRVSDGRRSGANQAEMLQSCTSNCDGRNRWVQYSVCRWECFENTSGRKRSVNISNLSLLLFWISCLCVWCLGWGVIWFSLLFIILHYIVSSVLFCYLLNKELCLNFVLFVNC